MMVRTRIKICGVTSVEDALLCAEAGTDAIGVIFYSGSKRFIDVARAREIVAALPAFVTPVGLFVNASVEEIRETSREVRLRHVQLQGQESPEMVASLAELGVIKAIHVRRETFSQDVRQWRGIGNLCGLMLDTATEQSGGSGIENDWETIRRARDGGAMDGLPPIVAAGGLSAENVARVIREIRPWAVDVCSGTEEKAGRKSKEKVMEFVAAVSRA